MNWMELARRYVPKPLKQGLHRYLSLTHLKLRYLATQQPLTSVTAGDGDGSQNGSCFGIVRNTAHYHTQFVKACQEMGLRFRVLDLFRHDWLDHVRESGCNVLLVWPDGFLSPWNVMIKDRVETLERELGYPCVPGSHELWMYEDKRRTAYWLAANEVPHPKTWVFYTEADSLAFTSDCPLPIVFKTAFGAQASGVRILRKRKHLQALARRIFRRGVSAAGGDPRDRHWGYMILQEYLENVREWRMVRIGDSYFGHPKERAGDFHSGSGVVSWDVPPVTHLDFLWQVTEKGGFRSMDVDVFETRDGSLLVNELQAVFGAFVSVDQLRVDGKPGRFVRTAEGMWKFEEGDFARNACANERVRDALNRRLKRVALGLIVKLSTFIPHLETSPSWV
jgi:hypothetical protein